MKFGNYVAALALGLLPALAPMAAHAQYEPNSDGACNDGDLKADDGLCYPVVEGAAGQTGLEGLPVLAALPAGAVVVGGAVVVAGVVVGVVAATDDDATATTTTSTTTTTTTN